MTSYTSYTLVQAIQVVHIKKKGVALSCPFLIFVGMKCPHCTVEFHDKIVTSDLGQDPDGFWFIHSYVCPNPTCLKKIFLLVQRDKAKQALNHNGATTTVPGKIVATHQIRPKGSSRPPTPAIISKDIAEDYNEACLVLPDSPKASAALSRRCLQHILREKAGVKKGDLAKEIQEVIDSGKLPTHIADSIDAVRNIGNFAAHPGKSASTGEVVPIEAGEAEWNLEVIEMLFDFYYVQPELTRQRRDALNAKLNDAGKPAMK